MPHSKFLNCRVTTNTDHLYLNFKDEDFSEEEWIALVKVLKIEALPTEIEFIQIQMSGSGEILSKNFY